MLYLVDLVRILTSPDRLIQLLSPLFTSWLGYALLFAIVFSETGLLVGFFLPGDSLMFHCQHCFCRRIRREHRRWYETILILFFLRPYRCKHCSSRFLGFVWQRFR